MDAPQRLQVAAGVTQLDEGAAAMLALGHGGHGSGGA